MIRHKPLPIDIEARLPEPAKYLESHPKVLFAYLFERHKFESLALRKYFDFQPRELNILQSKVIGHGR
jgi:hypothetical protein